MQKIEEIIDHYRQSDSHRRLHIYLQYPELRRQFVEIDQEELILVQPSTSTPQGTWGRFGRALRQCFTITGSSLTAICRIRS